MSKGAQVRNSGGDNRSPGVARGSEADGYRQKDTQAFGVPEVIQRVWPFKFSLMDNRWYVNKSRKRAITTEEALF